MKQAITTKFLGPTNNRGARIKATARKRDNVGGEMSATVDFSYIGTDADHCRAAKACAVKYDWSGIWIGGGNVDGTGNVFVNIYCSDIAEAAGGTLLENLGIEDRDWFFVPPSRH